MPNGGRSRSEIDVANQLVTESGKRQIDLANKANFWATPDACLFADGFTTTPEEWQQRRDRLKETANNGNGCGTPLAMQAHLWPTPAGMCSTDRSGKAGAGGEFAQMATSWPTPSARDGRSGLASEETLQDNARPLNEVAVSLWQTPMASEATRGGNTFQRGNLTPSGTSRLFGHQGRATSTPGEKSSRSTKALNPRFVEWLMGLPFGWTGLEPVGTQWSRWWRRMRSELSRLLSPPTPEPDEPAAAANLFDWKERLGG